MVTVYGADWCEDTQRSRRHLRRLAVLHLYANVDEDAGALARAMALNGGTRRTPTIDMGGHVLVEPSNRALTEELLERGLLTREQAEERVGVQNVGDLERALRAGGGLLALILAERGPRALRWPLRLAGAGAVLSGVSGWCPAYRATRVTSLDGPGDHPAEAERAAWAVPLAMLTDFRLQAEAAPGAGAR